MKRTRYFGYISYTRLFDKHMSTWKGLIPKLVTFICKYVETKPQLTFLPTAEQIGHEQIPELVRIVYSD